MCNSAPATHLGEAMLCEAYHDIRRAQGFARVVQLAADLLEAPVAWLCLRSGVTLRLAADVGLDPADRPFCQSFGQHVIGKRDAGVVELHAEDGLRFAAGVRLLDGTGETIGALCILDRKPRAACSDRERRGLANLAAFAVEQVDLWLQRKLDNERLNLLDLALASTTDGVLIIESTNPREIDARIVFANPAICSQYGYSPQDLIGQSPRLLQAESSDPVELDRVAETMWAGQSFPTKLQRKRRDGSVFWGEVTVNPLFNEQGRLTHWVSIQRDATEKHLATAAQNERERAISEVADRLLRSQRLARLGHWRWTIDTNALEWAETNYSMFGVSPENFTPSFSAVMAMIHPDDRPKLMESMRRTKTEHTPYAREYRTIGADGVMRHIWSEVVSERDARGKLVALSGIVQDITERKEAQDMLMRSEKLRSIGQLTGGIAHDFNNLLTVVTVNLEIMGDFLDPNHPAEALRLTAMRAADSGAQMTANLLAFARRRPLLPEPVQINKLLEDIRDLAVHSIGARHVITLQMRADLPDCLLDRSGFEGAVLNLLLNSRDAMPNGGSIRLKSALCRLPSSTIGRGVCLAPGDYICVTVSDDGTGIPPELLERVFEPFFTTKAPGKGSGLGLSTVIGFVRQSGGDVELASQPGGGLPGGGTTVRLYLPIFDPAVSPGA